MRDIKQSLKKLMAKIDQPPKESPVRQHLFGDQILDQSLIKMLHQSYSELPPKSPQRSPKRPSINHAFSDVINDLNEQHRLSTEELKITYELQIINLKQSLQRAQQKIEKFENSTLFKDVFQVYNQQTHSLESNNRELVDELRKLMKVQTSDSDKTPEQRTVKHLRSTLDRVLTQLQHQSKELAEYKQKDRLFELHKRCAVDGHKKIERLEQELSKTKDQVHYSQAKKQGMQFSAEQAKIVNQYLQEIQRLTIQVEQMDEENLLLKDLVMQKQRKPNSK